MKWKKEVCLSVFADRIEAEERGKLKSYVKCLVVLYCSAIEVEKF
jgi:hypothetical protein